MAIAYNNRLPRHASVIIKPSTIADALKETDAEYVAGVENTEVFAPLPETVTIGMANQVGQTWDFWKVLKNIAVAGGTFGVNANKGIAERQFWQEIELKDVTLELSFVAYESAHDDVFLPCQQLLRYTAASDMGQSSLELTWRRPVYVDVVIGRIAKYHECIIKSTDINFSNKLDAGGYPISATVTITFITRDPMGYSWLKYGHGVDGKQKDRMIEQADALAYAGAATAGKIAEGWRGIGGVIGKGFDLIIGKDAK